MNATGDKPAICIVMPVFNLLSNLAEAFRPSGILLDIILVNDASTENCDFEIERSIAPDVISEITIVDLRVNVGHQIAITAGLHFAQQHKASAAVLIMDADGKTNPTMQPN